MSATAPIKTNTAIFQEFINIAKRLVTDQGLDKKQVQKLQDKIQEFIKKNSADFFTSAPLLGVSMYMKDSLVKFGASISGKPSDAQMRVLKRRHRIIVDVFEANRGVNTVLKAKTYFEKFANAIKNDDVKSVQRFLNSHYIPKYAQLPTRHENVEIPTTATIRSQVIAGLAIAGEHGAEKVHDLLLETEDPNFSIHYITPGNENCPCGDGACDQPTVIPAWLATATSDKIDLKTKLIFLQKQLERGADPLLLDTDGKFWLTRVVRINHWSPAIMHLFLGSVNDTSKFYRIDKNGNRVSLIEDWFEHFKTLTITLKPKGRPNDAILAAMPPQMRALLFGPNSRTVFAGSEISGLMQNLQFSAEEIAAIKKCQENFFNTIAVMIAHGIECPAALAKEIENQLKIDANIGTKIASISADKLTVRTPTQAIAITEMARKELLDLKEKVASQIKSTFSNYINSNSNQQTAAQTATNPAPAAVQSSLQPAIPTAAQTAAQTAAPNIDLITELAAQYAGDPRIMVATAAFEKMLLK